MTPPSRRRRLIVILLGYIVATGAFLGAMLALLRADVIESGEAQVRSFAQVVDEQTTRTVEAVDRLLGLVQAETLERIASDTMDPGAARSVLRSLLEGRPYVRAIWFLDRDGTIRFDSDEGNIGINLADRPYFAQYKQDPALALRVNDPILSRSTGQWFIPITKPIHDDAGRFVGVAVASLELSYLDRIWTADRFGAHLSVVFYRRDGTVLARSPFVPEIMGRSMRDRALFREHLPAHPTGVLIERSFVDGQMRLLAYRILFQYPDLLVVVSHTVDHVLAAWWRFVWLAAGGWAVSSAALAVFAWLLLREAARRRRGESDLVRLAAERAAILDALPAHVALLDRQGAIVAVNEAWRRFGVTGLLTAEHGGVGANYLAICDAARGPRSQEAAQVARGIRSVLDGGSAIYSMEYPCHTPTEQRWYRLMVAPLQEAKAGGAVVMHVDITDRKQDDQMHAAESRVLEMISTGAGLPAVLERVTLLIEEIAPATTASIVLLDRETQRVRNGAAPNLPEAYRAALEGQAIGPSAGSCGTAMFRGEQVIVTEIDSDPLWNGYRDLVRPYGFRACWSTPIVDAAGQVLASFALYLREPREPLEHEQRLIDRAVHLVRIAIEHARKDDELRAQARVLREGELRFQALANATFDAIWDRDIKANTVWWSEGFRTAFGFTEEEVARRPLSWRARVHPDDLKRVLEGLDDAMRRKATDWHDEYRFFDHTGKMLYISDHARFIYDENGEASRLIGGMSDVTSMHEARARIEDLQKRLETLIDSAKVGILVHRQFKPVLANPELARMFGYAGPDEVLALEDCRGLFAPEELERISRYYATRTKGGDEVPGFYSVKGRKKNGTIIALENRAFAIPWEGQMSVCAMLVDITDRLALEEQLRQSQRLEAVGQLTGGVAHDFNNLLQVILGNAEHLARSLADRDELRQMAEMTRVAAERGAMLTNRLLAFARRQTLAPASTDVGAVIGGMSGLLRRTLGEQVTINLVQAPDLWRAFIDTPQLESAVLNLCINARDAMPGGGKLTIELANATLDRDYASMATDVEPGDYVLVAISDTGQGMTPEVLARAFEPFFTTKEVGKGSGLGLSMVLGFIKQSRGHVKIYSEPGQGTTIKLYLPRAAGAPVGRGTSTDDDTVPRGDERVLLVEDDDLVRRHAAALLKSLGYTVSVAADGHEALALMRNGERFDLLFTDVVMPGGLNGRQVAEEAERLQPGLPVLFTSGYTDTAMVEHGHLPPGVQLLPKPYRRQDLARKLREILARRSVAT